MSVGVIPIPFQIAMLAAGATRYSFFLFMLAPALSRALRYYGLGRGFIGRVTKTLSRFF